MAEIVVTLSAHTAREIEALARNEGSAPVSLEDMASALLEKHVTLIRDCGDILPGGTIKPKRAQGGKVRGRGGVSVGGGINGPL